MAPTATATEDLTTSDSMPAAFAALDERYARLPIDQIVPSKTNPRTHFDDTYLGELARSIVEKGIVQPILVRQIDAGSHKATRYEIVAGECRYRASKIAQQTHLPSVIRLLSDEQVLEIQLIENLHRRDLTALEQAAGYRALIKSNPGKHTAASIAQRLGMSEAWVWDRLKLNDLVQQAKDLLEQGRITVGHAILIARQKPADQGRLIKPGPRNGWQLEGLWQHDHARLLDEDDEKQDQAERKDPYHGLKAISVRELETWIRDHIRFDVEHAAKAQPLTFEPIAARVSEAEAKVGRGKKVIAITHSYRVADDARDPNERTYGQESWQRADGLEKSKTCDHSVLGVVVAGAGQGETLQVCVNREQCRVHFGDVIRQKEKNQQLRDAGKGKQAAKNEKRTEQSWEIQNRKRQEEHARWDAFKPHAIAAVVAKIKPAILTDRVLQRAIEGLSETASTYAEVKKLLGGPVTAKNFTRALDIVEVCDRDHTREYFKPIAKRYKVDLAKLEKDLEAKRGAAAPAKKS